jgi:hypothetical protein
VDWNNLAQDRETNAGNSLNTCETIGFSRRSQFDRQLVTWLIVCGSA